MDRTKLKDVKLHLLALSQGLHQFQLDVSAQDRLQKSKTKAFIKKMKRAKKEVSQGSRVHHIALKEISNDLDILLSDINHHLVLFRMNLLPLLEVQDSLKKVHHSLTEDLSAMSQKLAELAVN